MASAVYGALPFAEQIAFFRKKLGNQMLTNAWTDVFESEHDHAFMVAGANRADLLNDFAQAIDRAIADGVTLADFRRDFDAIVARHGWDYQGGRNWRSRVIYETNLRTSYAAGRYAQLMDLREVRPYWRYVHSDAVMHPRPLHLSWHNLVLRWDDPWWRTHFGPNGWGCQCTVEALNQRDLDRLGLKLGTAPPTDMQEVLIGPRSPGGPRAVETPAGIDPGFAYAPGRDAWEREHVSRILQAADAQQAETWHPIIGRGPADYARPQRLPLATPPAPPLPTPETPAQMLDTLRQVLGGESALYDVKGLPVLVGAQGLYDHIAEHPDRGRYLHWLPDLLENPQEVWMQLERGEVSGRYRIRARLIKTYDLGKGQVLMFIADQQNGVMTGWTFFHGGNVKYAQKQRNGLLWWGEGMPEGGR